MASSGVLPWLVGLPASDTAWDAAPAPPAHGASSHQHTGSPKSEPGTMRSRIQDNTEGTVNRRAQSSSPIKQPSLAWKSRLINGQTSYGDQTDLFGPSGLENIFARNQAADSTGPQKKHRPVGLSAKLSSGHENGYRSPPMLPFVDDPPFVRGSYERRSSEDSAEGSPASQSSQSSVVDMLTEMMGKMDELNTSNKGYHTRMQAIKDRMSDSEDMRQKLEKTEREKQQESEELRQKLETAERERQEAKGSILYQKGQLDKSSAELFKSQRRLFDSTKQTISAGRRADLAKSERRQLAENYNVSRMALSHMRGEAEEWREKYEEAQSELESLRSASPKSADREAEPESPNSEIITRCCVLWTLLLSPMLLALHVDVHASVLCSLHPNTCLALPPIETRHEKLERHTYTTILSARVIQCKIVAKSQQYHEIFHP